MKYNIYINQYAAVQLGLNLDLTDLAILDIIATGILSGSYMRMEIGGKSFYWVQPKAIAEDAPILGISTDRGIKKRLDNLVEAGMLEKSEENQKLQRCYYAIGPNFIDYAYANKTQSLGTTVHSTMNESSKVAMNESSDDNNTTSNNTTSIYIPPSIDKSILPPKSKKSQKIEYAEGVKLRPEEYQKLVAEYGEEDTKGMIEFFSLYKQEKGYKNKEDYLSIRRWVIEAYSKEKKKREPKNNMSGYAGLFASIDAKYHPERFGSAGGVDEQ